MLHRVASSLLMIALGAGAACASPDYAYLSGYAFLFNQGTSKVSVVDVDVLDVADQVDIGLAPISAAILSNSKRIAAADGVLNRVVVYDLRARELHQIETQFAPKNVIASADGRRFAAIDPAGGRVALIDAGSLKTVAALELARIDDVMFDGSWERLHVIQDGVEGFQTYDARNGQVLSTTGASAHARYSTFSHSPTGREIFARLTGSDDVDVIDVVRGTVTAQRKLPGGQVYPSGGGRYLLSVDETRRRFVVDSADPPSGASDAFWDAKDLYSAWFDTVAFATRTTGPQLLVYDLDNKRIVDTLNLPSSPGRGAVSADGSKVFLPLPEGRGLAVVDARYRSISKIITTNERPFLALIAGAYGLCH
jgi:DNA-binding beta-propeller fold protein YncE